ncbi:MAG: 3-hydroxyacyl-CoA dehydrogenase family protein, partial [Planctomycetota bacterium]
MSSYRIKKFAVIGAGNMGSGIAQKIATEGYECVLVDLDDEKVARGLGIIRKLLDQGVERKVFRPQQAEAILGRLHGTSDWSDLADVDLVVEAVFEDVGVKRSVFERLSEHCKPTAILATNTSSFYVKDLVDSVVNPERLIGLHYFFHPAKNRLVEVIGHEGTDPAAFRAAWASQEAVGKTPIWSADAPGFVVNRYFVPWVNEGVRLLGEGVADIPTIEWAAKKAFGVGMGPFELLNQVGVERARALVAALVADHGLEMPQMLADAS